MSTGTGARSGEDARAMDGGAASARPSRPAWREPGVIVILGTSFFAALSLFMVIPFLTIHLTSSGLLTMESAGVVVGVSFWIKRGGSIFGGMAADRFGRHKVMLFALALRLPGYVLLAYGRSFLPLLAGSALVSLGSAFYMPAAKSALTILTPVADRVRVFAIRTAVVNAGAAVGPIVGAALLARSSELIFLVAAGVFVVLAVANALIRFPEHGPAVGRGLGLMLSVIKDAHILRLALFGIFFFVVYIQTETIFPVFVKDSGYTHMIGWLFGFWAALIVIMQIFLSRYVVVMPRPLCLLVGFLAYALGFVALRLAEVGGSLPLLAWLFVALSLFSLAEVVLELRLDYDTSLVPPERVGTSFGFVNLSCGVGGLIGGSLGAFVYQAPGAEDAGLTSTWALMALLSVGFAIALVLQRGPTRDAAGQQPE